MELSRFHPFAHENHKMNFFEKAYSTFAVTFAMALIIGIFLFPQLRLPGILIPACLIGLAVNIGLIYIVLKDIFLRQFTHQTTRFLWLGTVLLIWPTIICYLFQHGFKPRPGKNQSALCEKNEAE